MNASRLRRLFTGTVVLLLLLTAAGKTMVLVQPTLRSEAATPGYLGLEAPYIPGWTNEDMMRLGVGFEVLVLVVLAAVKSEDSRLILIAWVGGVFASYHLGLATTGYREPCTCLGGPADWLHLSRRAYDGLTLGLVAYFLVGAYGLLLWRHRGMLESCRNPAAAIRPRSEPQDP